MSTFVEIRQSRRKNRFWGVLCLICGLFFIYSAVFANLGLVAWALAALLMGGATLFIWDSKRATIALRMDDSGVWISTFPDVTFEWEDIYDIEIDPSYAVVVLRDVDKRFPNSSWFLRSLAKRMLVDLEYSDSDPREIDAFVMGKLGSKSRKSNFYH